MTDAPVPVPPRRTALDLLRQGGTQKLSFGCPLLDDAAGGGVLRTGITEIAGEAAAGKTQLLLQLVLQVHRPPPPPGGGSVPESGIRVGGGFGAGAVYISTEGKPPISRLKTMASHFERHNPQLKGVLERTDVMTCRDAEDLWETVVNKLPVHLEMRNGGGARGRGGSRCPVGLVAIDSIAAAFRVDFTDFAERAQWLTSLAAHMKATSSKYNVPFVIANQVTDAVRDDDVGGGGRNRARVTVPALGLAWSNCVNVRLRATRLSNNCAQGSGAGATVSGAAGAGAGPQLRDEGEVAQEGRSIRVFRNQLHQLRLEFSPVARAPPVLFVIDDAGCRGQLRRKVK